MKKLLVLSLLLMAGTVLHAQTTATVPKSVGYCANAQSANATMRFRLQAARIAKSQSLAYQGSLAAKKASLPEG
jgi:hypothetical protein